MKRAHGNKVVLGALSLLLVVSGNSFAALSWNTADGFSAVSNPNGVWQYGYETTLGGTFSPYSYATKRGTAIDFWTRSASLDNPSVFHNPNMSSPVSAFDFTLQPNQTAFHPGPNGQYSLFRWTAPNAGLYSIHADFVGLGGSSTTDVHVLVNGVGQFVANLSGRGTTSAFDAAAISLLAGQTIDFAVGYGTGGYGGDTTGINATIAAVPEGSSFTTSALLAGILVVTEGAAFFQRKPAP
jgi:hypothetical protein